MIFAESAFAEYFYRKCGVLGPHLRSAQKPSNTLSYSLYSPSLFDPMDFRGCLGQGYSLQGELCLNKAHLIIWKWTWLMPLEKSCGFLRISYGFLVSCNYTILYCLFLCTHVPCVGHQNEGARSAPENLVII